LFSNARILLDVVGWLGYYCITAATIFRMNIEITMRERVKFDIPAVHAGSDHFKAKQYVTHISLSQKRKSTRLTVWSGFGVGILRWYRQGKKQGETHTSFHPVTER